MCPFDRTYEGLKREAQSVSCAHPEAFDRTYEGLKRIVEHEQVGLPGHF